MVEVGGMRGSLSLDEKAVVERSRNVNKELAVRRSCEGAARRKVMELDGKAESCA